jgi:hypothetical protein
MEYVHGERRIFLHIAKSGANAFEYEEREKIIKTYKTKVSFHVGFTPLMVFVRCVCPDPI